MRSRDELLSPMHKDLLEKAIDDIHRVIVDHADTMDKAGLEGAQFLVSLSELSLFVMSTVFSAIETAGDEEMVEEGKASFKKLIDAYVEAEMSGELRRDISDEQVH